MRSVDGDDLARDVQSDLAVLSHVARDWAICLPAPILEEAIEFSITEEPDEEVVLNLGDHLLKIVPIVAQRGQAKGIALGNPLPRLGLLRPPRDLSVDLDADGFGANGSLHPSILGTTVSKGKLRGVSDGSYLLLD